MAPLKTECNVETYSFGQLDRRQVVADFSSSQITNDGGLILIDQIDQQYQISERLACLFCRPPGPSRVQHSLENLVAQQLYGLGILEQLCWNRQQRRGQKEQRRQKPIEQKESHRWLTTLTAAQQSLPDVDYIHYNPVKHSLVAPPKDWACPSFHRYVRDGGYSIDWGAENEIKFKAGVGLE